jgi:hypothetical protein
MSIAEIAQAARLGANIELVYTPLTEDAVQRDVDAIRAAGAPPVVLSSDLGQPGNPLHPDGPLALYKALRAHGITAAELVEMSQTNPAKLLDLK